MAGKLVPLDEAAKQLGVTAEQLNDMRQNGDIYGYRDGASWKFKPEDVQKLLEQRGARRSSGSKIRETSDDLVLLSEVELGGSTPGASSTVIGKPGRGQSPEESDIKLIAKGSESDLRLDTPLGEGSGISGLSLADEAVVESGSDPTISGGGVELASSGNDDLGSDLSLGSSVTIGEDSIVGSPIDLSENPEDDLILGSGGSDITLSPGDSGISLVDPADSGLSLEDPLDIKPNLADSSEFEISDSDEVVDAQADFDSDAVLDVKSDDEFLLTPLEDSSADDSEDSGSQVIALDTESSDFDDSAATVLGGGSGMLELDDFGEAPAEPFSAAPAGGGFDMGGGMAPAGMAAPVGAGAMAHRETQFSGLVIVSLFACVLFLSLCGIMLFDLVMHMWSWDEPYSLNSSLMDAILGIFG